MYHDKYDREFDTPDEAIESWKEGCDCIIDEEADEEDREFCTRYNLCDDCQEEVDRIEAEKELWEIENKACDMCGEVHGSTNLTLYEWSEWSEKNGQSHKNHFHKYLCDECYEEVMPSIDPDDIASAMTADEEKQEEIAEAIKNNIETKGSIWKQLKEADEEERWEIIRIMGVARDRHENTDYDDMLKSGVDRDTARELIKQ